MIRQILLFAGFLFSVQISAQTGIGTTTPNTSAKLDVFADNKGFLPPRVTLTSATDNTTVPNPAEGLLVYNKGSVGLQAGYYYWNGANWATIATSTSAGNGVAAMDMVKLYSKSYSAATPDSTIANATGYKFTVPVSGRYLFDFSSSGYLNQATMSITFKIRQGTTDLGTDVFTNANNNVHVVFTGMVEVNLSAGVIYNVYVSSTGSRDAGDYDRVFYKLVAGNLPVTGQTVDYISVTRTGSDQTVNNSNEVVVFNTINGGNIPYNTNTGLFTLSAGKTYKLIAGISLSNANSVAKELNIVWKNAAGDILGSKGEMLSPSANVTAAGGGIAYAVYTPLSNTTVGLYVNYSSSSTLIWQNFSFASIEQIGSSAIINPWTLSGTNTYNTTGNVGIGTNNPTEKLDVTGTVGVSGVTTLKDLVKVGTGIGDEGGEINFAVPQTNTTLSTRVVADIYQNRFRIFDGNTKGVYIDLDKAPIGVSGEISYKASGIVNAGTFVQLDNLKVTIPTSGNRSLSIASVSGSFAAYINATYTLYGGGTNGTGNSFTVTTTPTLAVNWNFPSAYDTVTYIINDATNNRIYRVIMMIGPSYLNNFISIERLH